MSHGIHTESGKMWVTRSGAVTPAHRQPRDGGDRMTRTNLPPRDLAWIMNHVRAGDGCWAWTVRCNRYGYAQFTIHQRTYMAHRVMYELLVGPIPAGLVIDHLCRNRACVNPLHMEPVTHAENQRRGLNVELKTHCAQGHPWIPENQYVRSNGTRYCRVCARAQRDATRDRDNERKRLRRRLAA